jgi:hypothetical protein
MKGVENLMAERSWGVWAWFAIRDVAVQLD